MGFADETFRLSLLLFGVYIILLLFVLMIMIRITSKSIKVESEKIQHQQLMDYYERLELQYDEIRKFRHDHINILSSLSGYIEERDMNGLAIYFAEKIVPQGERFETNEHTIAMLSKIEQKEIKGFVAAKLIRAQSLNIDVAIELEKPIDKLNIDVIDMCRILGVILDNALEEAQLCKIPSMEFTIVTIPGSHTIFVKNSCRQDIASINEMYQNNFSTKGEGRGQGLNILKETLQKYPNTRLSTYTEDGYFIQEIEIDEERCGLSD